MSAKGLRVRQVCVDNVAMPVVAVFCEASVNFNAGGHTRADPAFGPSPDGSFNPLRRFNDRAFRILVRQRRENQVLSHAMGNDVVTRVCIAPQQVWNGLCHQAVGHQACGKAVTFEHRDETRYAVGRIVAAVAISIGVDNAFLQHIAHGPDTRSHTRRPHFEREVKDNGNTSACWPDQFCLR